MSDDVKNLVLAIGAIAETTGLLRDGLMKSGFTREEAVDICKTYISTALTNAANNGGKAD